MVARCTVVKRFGRTHQHANTPHALALLRARRKRPRRRCASEDRDELAARRVEDRRGGLGHVATLRFLSSLIKPDVPISGIRLSDQLHRKAHGGG